MTITTALAAIILNAPGLLNVEFVGTDISVRMVASGQEYHIRATSSRCTVYRCNSRRGAHDGGEICRFYGDVEAALVQAVEAVAAA